jgi:hypothetical protein
MRSQLKAQEFELEHLDIIESALEGFCSEAVGVQQSRNLGHMKLCCEWHATVHRRATAKAAICSTITRCSNMRARKYCRKKWCKKVA